MPTSPRPQASNFKTHRKMVSEGKLIDFDHVAAGHEGVQSTATGELIFKPCTQSEVAFYESAGSHPEFQKHIPVYVGALTLRSHLPDLSAIHDGATTTDSNPPITGTSIPEDTPIMTTRLTPEMSRNIMPLMAPPPVQGWTPSGGKRIDSGLLIALENVAYGFQRPNILDVKLGARLWADDAPPAKRAKLDAVSKETTSSSLGFRIAGMKIWMDESVVRAEDPAIVVNSRDHVVDKDGYRCYNKGYGRAFQEHNVKQGFESYFYGLSGMTRSKSKAIIDRMIIDLRDIEKIIRTEESRMYSSSILMVYEGDPQALDLALELEQKRLNEQPDLSNASSSIPISDDTAVAAAGPGANSEDEDDLDDDDDDDEEQGPKVYDVRLIDFAHAEWTAGQGPDENILHGIRNVLKILEELLND